MLIEIVTFSLTVLTSISSLTTHSLFWQQPTIPLQSPIPKEESIVQKKPPQLTLTQVPTNAPTPTSSPTPTMTPTPTSTPTPTPEPTIATVQDLETLFSKFADGYHVDKELLKRIAKCESGFNSQANFNNLYVGMYQFSEAAWANARTAIGLNTDQELRKNPEEAIRTAAYMVSKNQQSAWPSCSG